MHSVVDIILLNSDCSLYLRFVAPLSWILMVADGDREVDLGWVWLAPPGATGCAPGAELGVEVGACF